MADGKVQCKYEDKTIDEGMIVLVPVIEKKKNDCYKCGPCTKKGMKCVQQFKFAIFIRHIPGGPKK